MSKTFQIKMAKPSKKDIEAAEDLMHLLNIIDNEAYSYIDYPDFFDLYDEGDLDFDNKRHAISLLNKLNELVSKNPGFYSRVISGMCHVIMYDKNKIIDPDSDNIDLHPRFQEMHDDLVRETQAARYWNKRYHEMVEIVKRKDRAFAMLAMCPIYDKDENLIAVSVGYKSPAVGANQNNQSIGENHEE